MKANYHQTIKTNTRTNLLTHLTIKHLTTNTRTLNMDYINKNIVLNHSNKIAKRI
jgi:hypothetical protein